ncbi:MAG: endonuclease [Candidatus Kerfeldbacteria bacterium CG08_land_8_20_14_0_20_43_14]|uniref:Endonuclease n=1 Tax=Candidatus Kerfeldbacteria bacterium CG08_land_8_20_14_0_20_43_14 TaxID=2014246 RepID=A0A2H0YR94_9BACT|nr:MAG: endonuclease [Candidatus Kerfeldbacteria bacterium CG08_land_8_20_14_0_20_43_14]
MCLHSEKPPLQKALIGHTSDLNKRILQYNKGLVKSTKAYFPWKIVYTENLPGKNLAYKRELQIKSYKHGEAFKKLINN